MKSFLNFLLFFIGTLYLKQVAFYKPQATCKAYKPTPSSANQLRCLFEADCFLRPQEDHFHLTSR